MQSNHAVKNQQDYIQDNMDVSAHMANAQRRLLELVALESAPQLSPAGEDDMEEFIFHYGLTASSFA